MLPKPSRCLRGAAALGCGVVASLLAISAASADPNPKAIAACDRGSEAWEHTRDKASCYIKTDDVAAIPKLLRIAKKASAWRTIEAPTSTNDNDIIWRETFYFAAEGAGQLAGKYASAELYAYSASTDEDTQRFGIRALAYMLAQLDRGYVRGGAQDRARYDAERPKVLPLCASKLGSVSARIQEDALATCIAEHATRDQGLATKALDVLIASPDDRVKFAALRAYARAKPDGFRDLDRLKKFAEVLARPLPASWSYDGVRWRDNGCALLVYEAASEPWTKDALLHTAAEVKARAGESPSEPCQKAAAKLPGANTLPAAAPKKADPSAPAGDGIPDAPASSVPEVVLKELAPLGFAPGPAHSITFVARGADELAVAPSGAARVAYGTAKSTLLARGKVMVLAENNNVLDTAFSRDGGRVAFVGATTAFTVRDATTGAVIYDRGRIVEAGAFAGGDPNRLVMFAIPSRFDNDKGQFWTIDAPFTDVPRALSPTFFNGHEVKFVDNGRRAILYDDRAPGSLVEVHLDSGKAERIARGVDGPIAVARDGSRVCYRVDDKRSVVCLRLADRRREVVAAAPRRGEVIDLSENGDKLFLSYRAPDSSGVYADAYAVADFTALTVTPLVGPKQQTGGVLAMNLAGTAIAAGSSRGVHVFHLTRKQSYLVPGGELYGVAHVVGQPDALAVRKEVSGGQDLYILAP